MTSILLRSDVAMVFQLGLALILGGALGIERIIAHKKAGLRTYAMVSLGACLFIIISEAVGHRYLGLVAGFSPTLIASSIITGIGFLGAGLIFLKDEKAMGLTTAAGLWVTSGIGMAVGFKLYMLAFVSTVLSFFIFSILWYVEVAIKAFAQKRHWYEHEGMDN